MMDIHFEIGGKRVKPSDVGDAIMQAMVETFAAHIRESVGSIRDPETGEFPTIVIRGEDFDNLHVHVEGSPKLIALVQSRLSEENDEMLITNTEGNPPKVFISYTSHDADLAKRVAEALQDNGIDTWWDAWCITTGDSLRQKIDEGLADCTHFLVLLTQESVTKPWVNQEMDAALVRKLNNQCRFLPVRSNLPASQLPPLLAGMHAPEITSDDDITQLIHDIHGINRKPALGPAPLNETAEPTTNTGYSAAANTVARYFVEKSEHGCFGDPMVNNATLVKETGLTHDDLSDALFELSTFFKERASGDPLVLESLFSAFDRFWKPWNPREDAVKLAADIMNDERFPAESKKIAELYSWEPRRLNPAVTYLHERDMIVEYKAIGHPGFVHYRVVGKPDQLRRFLKSRQ
jgi:hypothetical protein